jgi:hypothetical protein
MFGRVKLVRILSIRYNASAAMNIGPVFDWRAMMVVSKCKNWFLAVLCQLCLCAPLWAVDNQWPGFRGPGSLGNEISQDEVGRRP